MFKIALLYRGQVRSPENGSLWQKKFHQYNSNCDIKTFCHTTNEVSVINNSEFDKFKSASRHDTYIVDNESDISLFRPTDAKIDNHDFTNDLIESIFAYWDKNPIQIASANNFVYDIQNRGNHQDLHNILSQFLSSNRSFNLLNNYVTKNNWVPDLVISLRYDTAFEIYPLDNVISSGCIFTSSIYIINKSLVVNDLLFASNFKSASIYYLQLEQRLFEQFTHFGSLFHLSKNPIADHLWWQLTENLSMFISSSIKTAILRPGYQIQKYDIDNVAVYAKEWNQKRILFLPYIS